MLMNMAGVLVERLGEGPRAAEAARGKLRAAVTALRLGRAAAGELQREALRPAGAAIGDTGINGAAEAPTKPPSSGRSRSAAHSSCATMNRSAAGERRSRRPLCSSRDMLDVDRVHAAPAHRAARR
jgi:hypothetical protein